jgi:hypothetical protein
MALAAIATATPAVLETNGGAGRLFTECYAHVTRGVVLELDPDKCAILARQRPTWSVYEGDCLKALAAGVGSHLAFDLIDVDPYGSPFEIIDAIFSNGRAHPDVVQLVVNDGLRQGVQMGRAWGVACLQDIVADFGNNLYDCYLDVAKEKVRRICGAAGFRLESWVGWHCGHGRNMTHYWAQLVRDRAA